MTSSKLLSSMSGITAMTAVDVSSENNSLYKSVVKSRNKQNSRLSLYVTEKHKEKNYKDR